MTSARKDSASILLAMPTLHVRNVPTELYERLRQEAAASRRSINAETIEILRQALGPGTNRVSMEDLLRRADTIRGSHSLPPGAPGAADLIREDREREH